MWLMNNFFPARRLRTVWMTVLMLLATQTAMADGTETSSNYMVMMAGMDQLQIQMPIYDEAGYDGWIDKGYIYVTPAGGIKQTLLYYYSEEKSGANPLLHYQKGVDGAMTLTPGNNSDVTVSSDLQNCRVSSSSDVFKVTVLWTVPAKMRGMELTISWSLHKKGNGDNITGEKDTDISISPTKITFPAIPDQIKPTVMEPMLGYDAAHAGQTMIIYTMAASEVTSLTAHYSEVNGQTETKVSKALEPEMSGFVYLDADRCYKDFSLEAHYLDTEGKARISHSDSITIPTLHQPYGLTAELQADGKVVLKWRCKNSGWNDILSSDTWDIQRNTSGAPEATTQWQSIDQLTFLSSDDEYTCTDNSMIDNYEGKPVYYRVRRSSTAVWDWKTGTFAQVSLPFTLCLPALSEAKVSRGAWNENRHEANFSFAFGGPEYDKQGRFILRTAADWEAFASKVNAGNTNLNAIMVADIDIGKSLSSVGDFGNNRGYGGTFDGNGHTLTVCYDTVYVEYAAPFRKVAFATIQNLHVAGKIVSKRKFAAGLAGNVLRGANLTVSNCRVSALVGSTIDGDASNGGFAAYVNGSVSIKNSLFDGQLVGAKSHSTGGFVGVGGTVVMENCLFRPDNVQLSTNLTSCQTFSRAPGDQNRITNCYFTTSLDGTETTTIDGMEYLVLRNATDWNTFISKVMSANGNSDVNAIMANDFNVIYSVGYRSNIPYRGTFEGNGHTLGVSINSLDKDFIAPFSHTKDAVIRNLNVVGQVSGAMHASGLVGSSEGSTLRVENCHVSVRVFTTKTHSGGILGHGHKVKNYIRNCLFDGFIEAKTYNSNSYAGAIMGWEDGGTSNVVENNMENGTYTNINHAGMNYNASGGGHVYGGTNNWNTHDWGECNKVGALTGAQLVAKLGSQWVSWGQLAVPLQTTTEMGQGISAYDMEVAVLDTLLNQGDNKNQWQQQGNTMLPVMHRSTEIDYSTTLWDKSAKLVLYTDKSVGGEVRYTERRELSEDERASGVLQHYELVSSCVDHDFRFVVEQAGSQLTPIDTVGIKATKAETGEAARYEFDNNVKIDTLMAKTEQSTVGLEWKVKGAGDFFRITRTDKATQKVDTLEKAYTMTSYIDRIPQPQHVYTYKVEGVNDCEGRHVSVATVDGWCKPTGMVRGYLRLRDGTALAGRKVTAEPQFDGGKVRSAYTDETGFFIIDSLVYVGQGSYKITAERKGDEGTITEYTASFNEDSNLDTKALLVMDSYYLLSGSVMYHGTSVPVIGAQFERDGQIVHNGSGKPVITDSQGRFSISVPQGQHTIRVVKDGHVFLDQGFYLDEKGKSDVSWQKSVHDYVFWDQTRVMLQGRVVGGDVQGGKPYGKLSSVNNLGDSLTIVMQLEGDNASYLVRDQLNASITERHTDYTFGINDLDTCHMDTYRHRLVIKPSPVTGEYYVPMLPVRYKVTEIYAEGYPTLFQAGKVGETLDLSGYIDQDTVTYSRIYHSAPTLDIAQYNMLGEDYMGIKSYTELDNTGKECKIELWNANAGYSFGHPVFMAGSSVIMTLSAVEKYYKNNNSRTSMPDIVHLPGGEVTIHNALIDTDETETVQLDSLGEGIYRFTPQNLTFTNEDDMALKTMTMTLLYDGTYYDVLPMDGKPIRGYVMASKAKSQGRRVVADGGTFLIDILRDPPGASSSAYIESGTKLNYTFSQNVKAQLGVKLDFGKGSGGSNMFKGTWAGQGSGASIGEISSVSNKLLYSQNFVSTYYNSWQYGYTFETTERISTSSGTNNVGRDADVFIGMTQNAIVEDAIAVRAISDSTYQRLKTHEGGSFNIGELEYKVPQGTMKVLAEGVDSKGSKVYLVRDEVYSVTSQLKSTFVHSAKYIEKELIPELLNLRNARLLSMETDSVTAQSIANSTGSAVYVSKLPNTDQSFGIEGNYTPFNPAGKDYTDSIAIYNEHIRTWIQFLALNEKEKLEASDLVKTYDVDGRSSISYSESFGVSDAQSRYWILPFFTGTTGTSMNFGGFDLSKASETSTSRFNGDGSGNIATMDIKMFGTEVTLKWQPIVALDYNYNFGKNESQSKKIGFTLGLSNRSNLLVDVYRTKISDKELKERIDAMKEAGYSDDEIDQMFFQMPTKEYLDYVKGKAGYGSVGAASIDYVNSNGAPTQYRSFVYRTRGGATCEPYEDERKTKYYCAGTLLDAKTIEIDRPRIWVEQASVSNVPYDEPARFTLHFVNESEVPAQATKTNPFLIFLDPTSNPKGARVYVDGHPMAGGGLSLLINPNEVVTKTLEVYPGTDYDYEDLQLGIKDPLDVNRWWTCTFSAHFVPVAGKVNISLPGDKWVVNTESQYDSDRQQYYMPVRIDGFDVNYRNFDHIELQYKLSTQGDRDWVNVCSYYKDSLLMAKATGECKLIEDDGKIMATFWGEADPIEQQYDLRAVNYCRLGNGFITRSSNILTGVKDTRRPQLFGTPKPEDGILGIGDDILLRFSEPIAGNYLRSLNNFQVLGQTNSNNISLSTDLRFHGSNGAFSLSPRNLSAKSFTVDMMINPENNNKNMTLFSHGDESDYLILGVSDDWRLTAVFKDTVFISETIPFKGLRQVAFVFKSDVENKTTQVTFYDGTRSLGSFQYQGLYGGSGEYDLAFSYLESTIWPSVDYEGEMLEFRLWNRALSVGEMNEYSQKRLTGYELGLLDNFPLNEGKGEFSFNRVISGGDLLLSEAAWNVPDGICMKLDGKKGFRIDPQKFSRTNYQDYTMMFWFRTSDEEGTLLSNGPAEDEADAKNHFNFGIRDGRLNLRLGGREMVTSDGMNDGAWHHVALTICRSRNVGNLYIDQSLKKTFSVDTLGGILGSYLAAGATYLGNDMVERPINGHIDEISMYEMALPENIIKATASLTPTGEELGLMAYLNFGRNELQQNNQQYLMPTGISLKRYRDWTTGELTTQRDTLIAQEVVDQLADKTNYAPMRGQATLENIPYSFVADGKDLLINLDLPDYRIEKTNVMVTVRNINDLNGNTMASPVTMDLYVYRNPLRWTAKQLNLNVYYGEEYTFEAVVKNLSGKTRRFSLEGLPVWITASQYNGVVGPLSEQPITFTISPYINKGDFDEVIYLSGEDEMSEPLPLNIKVRGQAPDWAVDEFLLKDNISMSIIGQVTVGDKIAHDPEDMLAVFNSDHRLLGVAHLDYDVEGVANDGLVYLNVYNKDLSPIPLYFEFYDASTGAIHEMMPLKYIDMLTFKKDTVIGTTTNPVLFDTNNGMVQTIPLKKGWNWVSFNVEPGSKKVKELLNNATKWDVGDVLEIDKSNNERYLIGYKSVENPSERNSYFKVWDYADSIVTIDPRLMYRLYSESDKLAYIGGYWTYEEITVSKGWNRIGYISNLNLPVATAMSIYAEYGSDGDIIKNQSEFAVLSIDASGNKQWKGTLKYLRVGEGYMLKRNADGEVSFGYPEYFSNTRYGGETYVKQHAPAFENTSGTSMTVVAVAEDVDVQPGDRLVAYRDADICGIAEADEQGVFYLSVGARDALEAKEAQKTSEGLAFTLERDDELLAVTTRSQITFAPDAALGSPDEPTAIRFITADQFDADGWYDLSGRKIVNSRLGNRKMPKGVYIHNNKKVIVK